MSYAVVFERDSLFLFLLPVGESGAADGHRRFSSPGSSAEVPFAAEVPLEEAGRCALAPWSFFFMGFFLSVRFWRPGASPSSVDGGWYTAFCFYTLVTHFA